MVEDSYSKEESTTKKIAEDNQNEHTIELEDKVVATPRTPRDLEEISIEKSLEQGMSDKWPPKPKNIYTHSVKHEVVKWRQKTRDSNKFAMNMKKVLNLDLKNETLIDVEEYSSEEDAKWKRIEGMLDEALENIEEDI